MQSVFQTALKHHRNGCLDQARAVYLEVLATDPSHTDSSHLLGVIAHQLGRSDLAIDLIHAAIDGHPSVAAYHSNLGNALRAQQRRDDAILAYQAALDIDPRLVETYINLSSVLTDKGRFDEATNCVRQALSLRPDDPELHNQLGTALAIQDRLDEAAASYTRAIELDPAYAEAIYNLGNIFVEMGQLQHAQTCFQDALERQPDFIAAHYNLANALRLLGRLDEAAVRLNHVLTLDPNLPEAHNTLGVVRRDQDRHDEAVASFHQALSLRPDFPDALNNLGNALKAQGDCDAAIVCLRQAIRLKPDFADAHNNLAITLLAGGDFEEGWKEQEWRWRTPQMRHARRDFAVPQWRGEPAASKTLLIHAEQGFGDTLQFCRYAPLASQRGLTVIIEAPDALVRLLRSLPGVERVVTTGSDLPPVDFHCPTLSLPLAFGTTLATVPAAQSYLAPNLSEAARWAKRLDALDPGPRVGLVWAGNPRRHSPALATLDRRRSLPPDLLAPLFGIEGLRYVSLQKDGPAAPAGLPITDLMADVHDFADTAALIANLDLVISVDSAVAHLAAALGKPVWLLDRFDPCWRWLTGRRDSPWYPTLRIYRQNHPGQWSPVISAVADDLRALAANAPSSLLIRVSPP